MSKQYKNPFTASNVIDAKKRFQVKRNIIEQGRLHEDNKKRFEGKNLSYPITSEQLLDYNEMCHPWMISIDGAPEELYTQLAVTKNDEVILIDFNSKLDNEGKILQVPKELLSSVKAVFNEEDVEYLKTIVTEEQLEQINKIY